MRSGSRRPLGAPPGTVHVVSAMPIHSDEDCAHKHRSPKHAKDAHETTNELHVQYGTHRGPSARVVA
eukprot:3646-Eustigmatos_ZCMA.PRE.1